MYNDGICFRAGYVCDDGANSALAQVVCRNIGRTYASIIKEYYYSSSGKILQ